MHIDHNENVVCFDVDDTLVIWDVPPGREKDCVLFDNFGHDQWLLPHEHHIRLLRQFKVRGQRVIVWSQGGPIWAAEVIKCLKLENLVDVVMAKPKWIIDDLPATAWTKRSYINLDGTRMKCRDVESVDFEEVDGDVKPNDQE